MPRVTKEKKKSSAKNKKKVEKNSENNIKDNKFSFDEEIIIGLKRIDEPKTNNKKVKHNKKRREQKNSKNSSKKGNHAQEPEIIIKSKYLENYEENVNKKQTANKPHSNNKKKNNKKYNKKANIKSNKRKQEIENNPIIAKRRELSIKRRKLVFKIVKILMLIGIIIGGIIYALLSPIFNVKEILVTGNSKISSATIVSLSGISIDQNIFNFRTSQTVDSIKQNAYIDTVEIKRNLPDTIEINVTEREPTFMINFGNTYVYINNQGYMLEITNEKADMPLITNYSTPQEEIKEGARLCTEDLEKLNDVLKIMEASSSNDEKIKKLITKINIQDKTNYILTLEKEKKQVHLGDTSNLSTKVLWIDKFIEEEEGNEGIIFLNVDLNNIQPYFREKV